MAIPAEELAQIEGIFGVDTYFRTETIPYQQGGYFSGQSARATDRNPRSPGPTAQRNAWGTSIACS